MHLKCPRCGYIWHYQGRKPIATCPGCKYTLRHPDQCLSTKKAMENQRQESWEWCRDQARMRLYFMDA